MLTLSCPSHIKTDKIDGPFVHINRQYSGADPGFVEGGRTASAAGAKPC